MDNKALEKEILEDLHKILFKLQKFEDLQFTSSEEGVNFVPSIDDIYDDESDYLDENGKLKSDVRFKDGYSDPVKFQEQYENFKLSSIKTLLKEFVKDNGLRDADYILGKYYTSTCY